MVRRRLRIWVLPSNLQLTRLPPPGSTDAVKWFLARLEGTSGLTELIETGESKATLLVLLCVLLNHVLCYW